MRIKIIAASIVAMIFLASAQDMPRVWTSCAGVNTVKDLRAVTADLSAHGVEVFEAGRGWNQDMRRAALQECRTKGLRLFVSLEDACRSIGDAHQVELAVMLGGAYQGQALDRHLFPFEAKPYELEVEPPVYSSMPRYAKSPHYMMYGDGHYYGLYTPTGRAEVIVPERLYDGCQHLKILPAQICRAERSDRYRLKFDLTGLENCLLDKVGLAVYWQMDINDKRFKPSRGCYSVFSQSVRDAFASAARRVIADWTDANGGTFPTDVIYAARLGDEVFNHSGFHDGASVNLPLWGFSESGLEVLREAMLEGETYARQFGFPEVYGETVSARQMRAHHQAAAEYLRVAIREFHQVGVKCFRNTTRCDVWSRSNDYDGTGQELLARELDFLHLDPYPISAAGYRKEAIPNDLAYFKGLSRRYGKPIILWMQAHAFGSGGLTHPSPEQLRLMYAQVEYWRPDAIMWLGYGWSKEHTNKTFPWKRPDSWAEAAKIHAAFRALPEKAKGRAEIAVVRSYESRVNFNDKLSQRVCPLVKEGQSYDVFEDEASSTELEAYKKVIR